MLAARLVGPSGEVVGIERDAGSIAVARARLAEAGFRNVSLTKTDASQIVSHRPFDGAVGRFILMFIPDPAAVLLSLAGLVRPGGVLAFQEPAWAPFLTLASSLPLWSKVVSSIRGFCALWGTYRNWTGPLAHLSGNWAAGAERVHRDRAGERSSFHPSRL
jgi:ubiquinone/menaquinone biosynthesis C-methylase UbiE